MYRQHSSNKSLAFTNRKKAWYWVGHCSQWWRTYFWNTLRKWLLNCISKVNSIGEICRWHHHALASQGRRWDSELNKTFDPYSQWKKKTIIILDVRITRMSLRHPYITSHTRSDNTSTSNATIRQKGNVRYVQHRAKTSWVAIQTTYQQEMVSSVKGDFKNNDYNITWASTWRNKVSMRRTRKLPWSFCLYVKGLSAKFQMCKNPVRD